MPILENRRHIRTHVQLTNHFSRIGDAIQKTISVGISRTKWPKQVVVFEKKSCRFTSIAPLIAKHRETAPDVSAKRVPLRPRYRLCLAMKLYRKQPNHPLQQAQLWLKKKRHRTGKAVAKGGG